LDLTVSIEHSCRFEGCKVKVPLAEVKLIGFKVFNWVSKAQINKLIT
jgi:hypothetical protein